MTEIEKITNELSRLSKAIANAMDSITEVANAAAAVGIEIDLAPDGWRVSDSSNFLPPIEYGEDGWSVDYSPLGGWRNKLIDEAIEQIAQSDHPFADEVLATVKPWVIFHLDMVPNRERFRPATDPAAKIASDAANRWWGVRLIFGNGYEGKFQPRDEGGFYDPVERFGLQLGEFEVGERHRVSLPGRGFDPRKYAENAAAAILAAPQRLAEQQRQRDEDEANGVVRPIPSPAPPPRP